MTLEQLKIERAQLELETARLRGQAALVAHLRLKVQVLTALCFVLSIAFGCGTAILWAQL